MIDLQEHRSEASRKHDELRDLIAGLGTKIDDSKFHWSRFVTPETTKAVIYLVLFVLGGDGAVPGAAALWAK